MSTCDLPAFNLRPMRLQRRANRWKIAWREIQECALPGDALPEEAPSPPGLCP